MTEPDEEQTQELPKASLPIDKHNHEYNIEESTGEYEVMLEELILLVL